MRRLLSTVLAIHWVIVFSLLALLCTAEPYSAVFGGTDACTVGLGVEAGCAAFQGLAFVLAASLFLWLLTEGMFKRGADTRRGTAESFRRACAGGVLALLPALCLGFAEAPAGMSVPVGEALLVAILASYLAVCAEHRAAASSGSKRDWQAEAARGMARGAAHHTLLSQISGRAGEAPGGRI